MRIQGSKLNKGFGLGRAMVVYSFHTWGLWMGNRVLSGDGAKLSGDCIHIGPFLIAYNLRLA